MQSPARNRVALVRRAIGPPRVSLVCIPFAGGNPELFGPWASCVADDIELVAVRLPGHGSRIRERPFVRWDDLVSDTCDALGCYLSRPHALYGHCFGARLAYEVARRSADESAVNLLRLFVSGCRSPDARQARPYVHELPDPEFRDALARTGGAPAEVLANAGMMRLLLPVVRAEIRLAELWDSRDGHGVSVPITAVRGRGDTTPEGRQMAGWAAFTTGECEFAEMPGGHLFLQADPGPVVDLINSRLATQACRN